MFGSGDPPNSNRLPPSDKRSSGSDDRNDGREKVQRPASSALILPPKEGSANYRYLELPNSLRVLLISNISPDDHSPDPSWTRKFPSAHCHEDANFLGSEDGFDSKVFEIVENGPALLARNFMKRHSEGAIPLKEKVQQMKNDGLQCKGAVGGRMGNARPWFGLTVTINAGSHSDPSQFQGLAHLVEHLVHYGCLKYPVDASFLKFIDANAGTYNAFTGSSFTNYHCAFRKSAVEVIREACDRYANMLSKPDFKPEVVLKELEAVDTEFYMRRTNHIIQALHLIPSTTIVGSHQIKQFDCGSKDYLLPQGIELNLAGDQLKTACHDFVNQNYTGANMTLVLQGPESLDVLQEIVSSTFGAIPAGEALRRDFAPSPPYDMSRFNSLYTIKPPRSNSHELLLQWALPAAIVNDYETKSAQFVAKFLKSKQPDGLIHYLKNKGWMVDFEVLVHGSRYSTNFYIYVELTQTGRDSLGCVIQAVFSFLKLLQKKGPQEVVFKEIKRVDEFRFNNMELDRSLWGLIRLSLGIHKYKTEDIAIGGTFLRSRFDRRSVMAVLNELVATRANYILFTWDVNSTEAYPVEPLYGTQFVVEKLSDDTATFFMNGTGASFPTKLPTNPFTIQPPPPCVTGGPKFNETEKVMSIHLPMLMMSPQAVFVLEIESGLGFASLKKNNLLMKTWLTMLNLELHTKFGQQMELGSSVFVIESYGYLVFAYVGFTGGLLEATVAFIEGFRAPLKEETFLAAKDVVKNVYFNMAANSFILAWDYLAKLKNKKHETCAEQFESMCALNFNALATFVAQYKETMHFTTTAAGYLNAELEECLTKLVGEIPTRRIVENYDEEDLEDDDDTESNKVSEVAEGTRCLRLKSLLDSEKVFAVLNYYEVARKGFTSAKFYMTYIIYLGLRQIAFNELRTKEQLGYAVYATIYLSPDWSLGIVLLVGRHTDKHCPCYIDRRMDALLQTFYDRDLKDHAAQYSRYFGPEFIAAIPGFYKNTFLPGLFSGMRKLTLQITGGWGQPMNTPPCQSGLVTPLCKKSIWMTPIHKDLGLQKAEIALAKDPAEDDTLSMMENLARPPYFIGDFAGYHSTNNTTVAD